MLPHAGRRLPALGIAVLAALVAGQPIAADAAGGSTWTPSTWTGVIAGAPVPGTGLPSAPMPGPLPPLPSGVTPVVADEPQTDCAPAAKPGAIRLAQIITLTYGRNQTTWIPRACDVGDRSEHKEGRAIDWMVSVREPQQRANAEAFLNWLLAPDSSGRPYANALQLGVMYIGWNDRIWRGFAPNLGWQELHDCFSKPGSGFDNYCHRNHIHISLTREGAAGVDASGAPIPIQPSAPAPPEAALDESAAVPGRPAAPAQPGPDEDLFMAIGSQLGFDTAPNQPLQPREVRTVNLAPVPMNATSALISVTTRKAQADTRVLVGRVGKKGNAVALRVPKATARTSVLEVPIVNGTVQLRAAKVPVHVRVNVLGYAIDHGVYPAVGTVAAPIYAGRMVPGEVVVKPARGVGQVPRRKSRVTAVILRVKATGKGQAGRFAAYPVGGADLGTTSALIPARGSTTTVLVADLGTQGQIALASSARARVQVDVVGYVQR